MFLLSHQSYHTNKKECFETTDKGKTAGKCKSRQTVLSVILAYQRFKTGFVQYLFLCNSFRKWVIKIIVGVFRWSSLTMAW